MDRRPPLLGLAEDEVEKRLFFDSLTSGIIVGENQFDARRLYIPSDDAPTSVTTGSSLQGTCDNFSASVNAVRLLLLDSDLHTTFPKPYGLMLN